MRVDPFATLPNLGVGLLYNPALPEFLEEELDLCDYVEVIPDTFQTDRGQGRVPRFAELEQETDFLSWLVQRCPIIAHHIGLSIGSAGVFDTEYVSRLEYWRRQCQFLWHSDHLSFAQMKGDDGQNYHSGFAMSIPYDYEVLDMVASRVQEVQRNVPSRFLLENNVYYTDIPQQEMTEQAFLNALSERTDCGLLLDLHNVYTNARNHKFQASEFIEQLNLSRVVEVHIAGGGELAGMYTDSHSGPCPEPVWDLLGRFVSQMPNLRAITFEFHESYFPVLGKEGIRTQLKRAREIWKSAR